jgi:lipopolysaccharide exporter
MRIRSQDELLTGTFDRPRAVDSTHLIARGMAQNILSRGCFFAFGCLAAIILARGLGPKDYGVYGLIMSVLLWVEQTSKFMIPPAAAILISKEDHDPAGLQQTALFLNLLLFLFLFLLLWFAAPWLADLFDLYDGANLFRVAALDLPFFGMYAVYRGVLQGHRQFLSMSIGDVLHSATKLSGVLLLVALSVSVPGALIVNVLASVAGLLFVMSRISVNMLQPARSFIGPLIYFALPLGIYMLALQTIGTLDLWSLKMLSRGEASTTIGFYVAARNIAIVPGVILMVISDVLLPSLSQAVAGNDASLSRHYLQGGVRFLCIVSLPIAWLFMLGAEEIVVLLYSDSFRESAIYLRVLILYALSLPFVDLFASALSARGQPYLSGATLFVTIPVGALLNIFFILRYGAVGAAYASVLTGLLGVISLGFLVYKRFGSLIKLRTLSNATVAMLLVSAIASQFTGAGLWLGIFYLGCSGVYVLGLVLLGEVTRKDLESLALWRSRQK